MRERRDEALGRLIALLRHSIPSSPQRRMYVQVAGSAAQHLISAWLLECLDHPRLVSQIKSS